MLIALHGALFHLQAHAATPVGLLVPDVNVTGPAWLLYADDQRQWVSDTCRSTLVDAGLAQTEATWNQINSYGVTDAWQDCATLEAALNPTTEPEPDPTSGEVAVLVTTSGANDGWLRYADGTRQWVGSECKQRLALAGISERVTPWSAITTLEPAVWQSCDAILLAIDDEPTPPTPGGGTDGPVLLLQAGAGSNAAGWILHDDNSRQWINSSCRVSLQSAGIREQVTDWASIASLPTGTWRSCETIASNIVSGGGQTGSGWSNPYGYPPLADFAPTCVGMNDDFAYSWDGGSLVADAFKQSKGPYLNDFVTYAPTDSDRWPIGTGTINFVLGEGDHDMEELNPWVLLSYDQSGAWLSRPEEDVWDLEGGNHVRFLNYSGVVAHEFNLTTDHINLKVSPAVLPSSPRNRWHLVPKSMAPAYAKAMQDNGFRYIFSDDTFTRDLNFPLLHLNAQEQMADFCRIRFMLGNTTNALEFSGYRRDRTKPAHPTFRTPGGDGIPFEWKVWIANHLGKNVWHTDQIKTWEGWRAGDRYLHEQARYYATYLRGDVIREYGNEIWNNGGPFWRQTAWVRDNPPYQSVQPDSWKLFHNRYGKRSWDTGGVWETAFSARRGDLDLTVGVQTSCPGCAIQRLQSPYGQSFGDRIDSVSGTFYVGRTLTTSNANWAPIANQGYPAVVDAHRASLATLQSDLAQIMSTTSTAVAAWHLYEGGSHMDIPNYSATNPEDVRIYRAVEQYWNSSEYTRLLTDFHGWWQQKDGAGELMLFNLYGLDSASNPWGYYKGSGDVTPRYRGAASFVRNAAR